MPSTDPVELRIEDVVSKETKEEAIVEIGGVIRPPMNQAQFDQKFSYRAPEEDNEAARQLKKALRSYYEPFTSCAAFRQALFSFFPILNWLPKYNFKTDLVFDILGGITLGIMHVPQGIAYSVLAKQDPVSGLYTSFFPPLLYMIFGTSRHNSIGSFAVVALMTGLAVDQLTKTSAIEGGEGIETADLPTRAEVAAALALTIGIITIIMGVLRLSFLTAYLSDQIVAGFTTGASLHVFAAQLKDLFGLRKLPPRSGFGNMLMKVYDVGSRLDQVNTAAVLLSAFSMAILILGKQFLTPYVQKKLKMPVPVPLELLVVIIGTTISYCMDLANVYHLKVVKTIPTGIPTPSLPRFDLVPSLVPDAVGIAIVAIAIHYSLAKMFAKKLNYELDPGQELFAMGLTAAGSSLVPVYPVTASLGRTMVNVAAGTKTQLSTIPSCLLLLSVMLYLGRFLEPLPMCVLAAIVTSALLNIVSKFAELRTLWPLSKIDFSIWVVSFLATACIDVMEGLGVSILFALFTTVMREQWPRWHLLGNVDGTTDYRDSERYQDVYFFHGICIFRFDSPLLFTNVERFKKTVEKAYRSWERSHEFYILRQERPMIFMDNEGHERVQRPIITRGSVAEEDLLSRHFIVDCSGFTFVDYMGVSTLKEVYSDMRKLGILVYFAAAKAPVRDLFESSGFYSFVAKENFYPTIRDAVAIARRRQLKIGQTGDVMYSPEHDRLSEILSSHPIY